MLRYAQPTTRLPENELTCYGLRMGLMEYVKTETEREDQVTDKGRTPDTGSDE